jgi:GMP synthase (glutamine-hydrolysing)
VSAGGERVLVVQHDDDGPPGRLEAWLQARGAQVDVVHAYGDPMPARADEHDFVVSLGSEASAYDDTVPWLAPELALLAHAAEVGVPVLGICFGAQILARSLGATVHRNAVIELGWTEVRTFAPETVAAGPWFSWHVDGFDLAPGAELLAESAYGVQAFRHERSLGVQFHPEVTPALLAHWVELYPAHLVNAGVDGRELVATARRGDAAAARGAERLFAAFFAASRATRRRAS